MVNFIRKFMKKAFLKFYLNHLNKKVIFGKQSIKALNTLANRKLRYSFQQFAGFFMKRKESVLKQMFAIERMITIGVK